MRRDVSIAQAEPRFLAEPRQLRRDLVRLAGDAPTLAGVRDARQRIQHGVMVRAHDQAVALQVVAGIDDDGQLAGRDYVLESVGEFRSPDSSGQTNDAHQVLRRQTRAIWQSVMPAARTRAGRDRKSTRL